jgi:hypothetical protein
MANDAEYHLGEISERHEGAGPATISTGRGDHGGVSYGTYQLSTHTGTIGEYLDSSSYGDDFRGLTPNTPAFDEKWRALANRDPEFGRDQTRFIKETHYDIEVLRLKDSGIDLTARGPAVQEALFSTSVQYRGLTKGIFERGLKAAYGDDYVLSQLSDKDIVVAIQDYKIAHNDVYFRSSSPKVRESILDRAANEKDELVALSEGAGAARSPHFASRQPRDTRRRVAKQFDALGLCPGAGWLLWPSHGGCSYVFPARPPAHSGRCRGSDDATNTRQSAAGAKRITTLHAANPPGRPHPP